ncbi:MAG: CBS domain-containing protein [Planctomycetes bacterium]|nr:CBS domain-containing protein [Planctomycetota bacterium]
MSIKDALRKERLVHLPLQEPVTVRAGTSLEVAIERMRAGRRGLVLVCEGPRLKGVFTERDLLRRVIGEAVDRGSPVDRYMTSAPETLPGEASVLDAIALMAERGIRRVPVVDPAGAATHVASAEVIVDYLAEHFPGEVLNLPPHLHQVMKTPEGG